MQIIALSVGRATQPVLRDDEKRTPTNTAAMHFSIEGDSMFRDRIDAAEQLAAKLKERSFADPVVLAVPRGGVVTGAILARELGAELDVVLSRKLRAPRQLELAIGAVAEDGQICLEAGAAGDELAHHLEQEREYQLNEIARRLRLFRAIRPPATVSGRSVIVTDDGIATGATIIAALKLLSKKRPRDLIVASPVIAADRIDDVKQWCDEVVWVLCPERFWAVSQFYEDFRAISDEEAVAWLRLEAGDSASQVAAH